MFILYLGRKKNQEFCIPGRKKKQKEETAQFEQTIRSVESDSLVQVGEALRNKKRSMRHADCERNVFNISSIIIILS